MSKPNIHKWNQELSYTDISFRRIIYLPHTEVFVCSQGGGCLFPEYIICHMTKAGDVWSEGVGGCLVRGGDWSGDR